MLHKNRLKKLETNLNGLPYTILVQIGEATQEETEQAYERKYGYPPHNPIFFTTIDQCWLGEEAKIRIQQGNPYDA